MNFREFFLENFAGDLEYHPRRAAVYFACAAGSVCIWFLTPPENKFTTVPLVFALGSLALLAKRIFLCRPSSEGIGMSFQEVEALKAAVKRKDMTSIPTQAAQMVQDFGTGCLLFWPLLNMGRDIDHAWSAPPRSQVFIVGSCLFGIGWMIRRFTQQNDAHA